MRVLLDECLPRRLAALIIGHEVVTVPSMGWAGLTNGALLRRAEAEFDAFITADQNLEYQQYPHSVALGLVVLVAPNTRLDTLRSLVPRLLVELESIQPGEIVRIV